ncbi:MAG: BatD family protein [Sulfurimonas sp.]
MKNIAKLLFLVLIAANPLFASLSARVDSKSVELGEAVTYSLELHGEMIKKPNITRLCESDVISTSSQTSMQIINQEISKSYTLSYRFVPQKSCKIAPLEVEIDGKVEASDEIEIEVKPVSGAKDLDFELRLSSDKKELYVGETFDVTLIFKQKNSVEAVDSEFTPPEFKGFWVKGETQPQRYQEGEYTVTKVLYSLAPQRVGEHKISKAQMRVASRSGRADSWGAWIPTIKWKTYFSNELEFSVKALPSGVDLVGNFAIKATPEKNEINANEALNLTIEVEGEGNLEDIKSFKQSIDGVAVFDEKIAIDGNKLTQKIAYVAERDFVIPPFVLRYFDPKTKEIKSVTTKEIKIEVKNSKAEEELNIQKEPSLSVESDIKVSNGGYDSVLLTVVFVAGLLLGVLAMMLKPWKSGKKEKNLSIKEPKVLLGKLLPFKDEKDVNEIVEILEKNIYSSQKLEIDKKRLKEVLRRHNIK